MAHIGVMHCLLYPGARWGWFRRRMPDLKATIVQKVLEHIGDDLVQGVEYSYNKTTGSIKFQNGSEMICRSWNDKQFFRLRSLELSGAGVEELTENDDEYEDAYLELYARVGRLPHVPESLIINATNPDDPSHWVYKRMIISDDPTRHVYYSVTSDNPFLPKGYVKQLLDSYDPKMAQRMVYGKWLAIKQDVVYYNYDRQRNYRDYAYEPDYSRPVNLGFDFNIADGKPMSCSMAQHIKGDFHFFGEAVVEGARTEDICMELADKLPEGCWVRVNGDATGSKRNTVTPLDDYVIIDKYFSNHPKKFKYERSVPRSNPEVRKRHNRVNAQFLNANGGVSAYVYKDAPVTDEGFRLTKLRKGGKYVEDDSKSYQHITTGAGYTIMSELAGLRESSTIQL